MTRPTKVLRRDTVCPDWSNQHWRSEPEGRDTLYCGLGGSIRGSTSVQLYQSIVTEARKSVGILLVNVRYINTPVPVQPRSFHVTLTWRTHHGGSQPNLQPNLEHPLIASGLPHSLLTSTLDLIFLSSSNKDCTKPRHVQAKSNRRMGLEARKDAVRRKLTFHTAPHLSLNQRSSYMSVDQTADKCSRDRKDFHFMRSSCGA